MRCLSLLISFFTSSLLAQTNHSGPYPQGFFRNPLNIPISLAGNFGELRTNHYHMGLDIKTNKVQNYPVYAAADGYVSRIKIEPGGFGRAIYITHPNGYTTLYAHLNNFNPGLEEYVKQQQYKMESWNVFLQIPPNLFPVKKGDFIAYSGTTGGSQAPHLHFEIRKTDSDINLNPLLFGMPVPDEVPPTILRLALYDRKKSIYEQSPRLIPVKKLGTDYETTAPVIISNSDKVSLGVSCYDKQNGSSNLNGVYSGTLFFDSIKVVQFIMDDISYDNTRNLNAHIDYKTKFNRGPYIQMLAELPGYLNGIYRKFSGDGVVLLADGRIHEVSVLIEDAAGNKSRLDCKIQYQPGATSSWTYPGKIFYPLMVNVEDASEDCEFYLGERALYDSVHINYQEVASSNPSSLSSVHTIGAPYIPLQDSLVVRIRPSKELDESQIDKVVMQRISGGQSEVVKVQWQKGWAMARFREFGSFQLLLDQTPPQIIPFGWHNGSSLSKAKHIILRVSDNLHQYKNFRAELDGKWLRFTNDKGKSFIYNFDEKCGRGAHVLKVWAEDEAGNKAGATLNFKR